jgi:hypothetical protein
MLADFEKIGENQKIFLISLMAVLLLHQSKVRFSLAGRFRYEGAGHVRPVAPFMYEAREFF